MDWSKIADKIKEEHGEEGLLDEKKSLEVLEKVMFKPKARKQKLKPDFDSCPYPRKCVRCGQIHKEENDEFYHSDNSGLEKSAHSARKTKSPRTCSRCNKVGHYAKKCPNVVKNE